MWIGKIPNGYEYSAAATGRFYAACILWVTLPYVAAAIKWLLEAGGWKLFSRAKTENFK